jgi:glycerophosphoryl diester phosphodiesterase
MHAPENTLDAFDLAVRLGAQILEMDVHATRDGEVVVIHDETLERTTDGHGRVRDKTLAELKELDAGHNFDAGGRDYRFRGRLCRIPTLREVISAFPGAGLNIELKQQDPPIVHAVLDALHATGPNKVLLVSREPAIMREIEAAAPGCGLGLSIDQIEVMIRGAYLGGLPQNLKGRAMQIPLRHPQFGFGLVPLTTRRVIRAAHRVGVEVHLWTINDPRRAARWIEHGADAIMTDDPSSMHAVFAGRWDS